MSEQEFDQNSLENEGGSERPSYNEEIQQKLRIVADGFRIVEMKMRNAKTNEVFWRSDDWSNLQDGSEKTVHFPTKMLECEEVSREIVFYSEHEITDFKLLQKISLNDQEIEQLFFKFGFVMPKSQNSWEQIIQADTENILPAEVLSGNLLVETFFLSGDHIVHRSNYRVYYN